eukprot:880476_1
MGQSCTVETKDRLVIYRDIKNDHKGELSTDLVRIHDKLESTKSTDELEACQLVKHALDIYSNLEKRLDEKSELNDIIHDISNKTYTKINYNDNTNSIDDEDENIRQLSISMRNNKHNATYDGTKLVLDAINVESDMNRKHREIYELLMKKK